MLAIAQVCLGKKGGRWHEDMTQSSEGVVKEFVGKGMKRIEQRGDFRSYTEHTPSLIQRSLNSVGQTTLLKVAGEK
jgi:hypothetical protein